MARGYQFGASPAQLHGQRARPYRRDEIDFLLACIVPQDAWFIILIRAIATRNHLLLPADSRPHPSPATAKPGTCWPESR